MFQVYFVNTDELFYEMGAGKVQFVWLGHKPDGPVFESRQRKDFFASPRRRDSSEVQAAFY